MPNYGHGFDNVADLYDPRKTRWISMAGVELSPGMRLESDIRREALAIDVSAKAKIIQEEAEARAARRMTFTSTSNGYLNKIRAANPGLFDNSDATAPLGSNA